MQYDVRRSPPDAVKSSAQGRFSGEEFGHSRATGIQGIDSSDEMCGHNAWIMSIIHETHRKTLAARIIGCFEVSQ